jgi:hypothetical protein
MSIEIMADIEYNATGFWATMREVMPELTEELLMFPLWIEVTDAQWSQIKAIEGFADGPEHAKFALISRPCNA